jgi:hypothetical protein
VHPPTALARTYAVELMAASAILFGLMAVTLRLAVAHVSAFEAAFFRSLFGLVFSLPLLYGPGLALLRTKNFHLYIVRALFGTLAMLTVSGRSPICRSPRLCRSRIRRRCSSRSVPCSCSARSCGCGAGPRSSPDSSAC